MLLTAAVIGWSACRRSANPIPILGTPDETADAAKIVADANQDLLKIRVLYDQNEDKRIELKKAMEANDAEKAKKIADDVVYVINDGASFANSAVEKLQKAQEMQINDDYREYLRLKEESLKFEIDAFENYRQAARMLRDSFDPKNAALREKVKAEFKTRSDNYLRLMEQARDYSQRANELSKSVMQDEKQ